MVSGRDGVPPEIRAQDDLYRHVNAAWLSDNPMSKYPAYGRWGVFESLADEALHKTRDVMAEDVGGKANAWLQSGLNAATQDSAAALAPILAHADALAAASVRPDDTASAPVTRREISRTRPIGRVVTSGGRRVARVPDRPARRPAPTPPPTGILPFPLAGSVRRPRGGCRGGGEPSRQRRVLPLRHRRHPR